MLLNIIVTKCMNQTRQSICTLDEFRFTSLLTLRLTRLDDINTGCISTQVIGSDTDVDSILVHLCDGESETATCRVQV